MTADELEVLRLHKLWLLGDAQGKRCNLRSANLSYADLSFANLSFANLSSADLSYANLRSANLRYADLSYADLSFADLRSANANLSYADLRYADLSSANLSPADLSYADLRYADLSSADLSSANLRFANLRYADLRSANLRYAKNLEECWLDTEEKFKDYLATVVPMLLAAGGKTLADVLATGCWDCHSWKNCPMAVAFDVHQLEKVPLLYQPRVRQFVQLFDAKLIPKPEITEVT